jgi:hypothetical protein
MFCGQPHHTQHAPASIVASAPAKLEIRPRSNRDRRQCVSRLSAEPYCSIGIDALKRAVFLPFLSPSLAFLPIRADFFRKSL